MRDKQTLVVRIMGEPFWLIARSRKRLSGAVYNTANLSYQQLPLELELSPGSFTVILNEAPEPLIVAAG